MASLNRSANFFKAVKNKIKNFFQSNDQKVHTENVVTKSDIEAGKVKDQRTTTGYSKRRTNQSPWYIRVGLSYQTKKLQPLNEHPVRCFGTFSPVKPFAFTSKKAKRIAA